ncbi:MAG: response regulator, partial [Nitrospinota bacterium]
RPGLDGPSTLRRLKEQDASADIPVIFLTAKVQRAEIQGLEELGPAGVLTKPFDPMKLSNQVLALLKD